MLPFEITASPKTSMVQNGSGCTSTFHLMMLSIRPYEVKGSRVYEHVRCKESYADRGQDFTISWLTDSARSTQLETRISVLLK